MKATIICISVLIIAGTSFAQGVVDGFFKGKNNADIALSFALTLYICGNSYSPQNVLID